MTRFCCADRACGRAWPGRGQRSPDGNGRTTSISGTRTAKRPNGGRPTPSDESAGHPVFTPPGEEEAGTQTCVRCRGDLGTWLAKQRHHTVRAGPIDSRRERLEPMGITIRDGAVQVSVRDSSTTLPTRCCRRTVGVRGEGRRPTSGSATGTFARLEKLPPPQALRPRRPVAQAASTTFTSAVAAHSPFEAPRNNLAGTKR